MTAVTTGQGQPTAPQKVATQKVATNPRHLLRRAGESECWQNGPDGAVQTATLFVTLAIPFADAMKIRDGHGDNGHNHWAPLIRYRLGLRDIDRPGKETGGQTIRQEK